MKTKYFIIYIFVGIAFLAVSTWVFFSRGKSAKAIRAKYRLGGILITSSAMLSLASCGGPGPFVTCYDPAPPEPTEDIISYNGKNLYHEYSLIQACPGDVLSLKIEKPTFEKYLLTILTNGENPVELQRNLLVVKNSQTEASFDITISEDITYRGYASVWVYGVVSENPENLSPIYYGSTTIEITDASQSGE